MGPEEPELVYERDEASILGDDDITQVRSVERLPWSWKEHALCLRAVAFLNQGDLSNARETLEEAMRLPGGNREETKEYLNLLRNEVLFKCVALCLQSQAWNLPRGEPLKIPGN